ncbi:RloB-like protein [Ruminococcus sp. YE71]|nr:RloB-like protein [Ruminococcus sp. YE78]SFW15465.1 RloB-like protein [Ruminococcus sp. YE71]
MHIEELDGDPLRKKPIAKKIEQHLDLLTDSYEKHKDDQGLIAKIILGYQNVEKAIKNAESLRSLYDEKGYEMKDIISGYYPYSNIDELVKQLAKATE